MNPGVSGLHIDALTTKPTLLLRLTWKIDFWRKYRKSWNAIITSIKFLQIYKIQHTVKPMKKGNLMERQNMVFIDKWSLFEANFV